MQRCGAKSGGSALPRLLKSLATRLWFQSFWRFQRSPRAATEYLPTSKTMNGNDDSSPFYKSFLFTSRLVSREEAVTLLMSR